MNEPTPPRSGPAKPDPEGEDHDLLDVPAVPLLGLSPLAIAAIFVGGALGAVLRYLLEVHHPIGAGGFPWPTLLINLSGSLAIGLILPVTEHASHRFPLMRPLLVVGFLGGWTTYSTLAVEATWLMKGGDTAIALAYLGATVLGGLALVMAGDAAARRLVTS